MRTVEILEAFDSVLETLHALELETLHALDEEGTDDKATVLNELQEVRELVATITRRLATLELSMIGGQRQIDTLYRIVQILHPEGEYSAAVDLDASSL